MQEVTYLPVFDQTTGVYSLAADRSRRSWSSAITLFANLLNPKIHPPYGKELVHAWSFEWHSLMGDSCRSAASATGS